MSVRPGRSAPVLVVGGGIGGMAVALALSQSGFAVEVFEQSAEIGEIGAGLQLGPNGFAAMDALGVGERARKRAVYTDELVMMDALDGSEVARIPVGEAFRQRFNNPYAVIHRADIHQSVYEEVQLAPDIAVHTATRIVRVHVEAQGVRLEDARGGIHEGAAVVGCDGVHSVVRERLIGDAQVNDTAIAFEHADTFCAPGLASVRLAKRSREAPAYLVMADESPLQRKLGVYEQR